MGEGRAAVVAQRCSRHDHGLLGVQQLATGTRHVHTVCDVAGRAAGGVRRAHAAGGALLLA